MSRPLIFSLAACALAVALEVLFAGRGIKQRFAELRVPRFVPPLWLWAVIGLLYYVVCFILLYRVLSLSSDRLLRNAALVLLAGLMLVNALWNYFFFRSRSLVHAYVIGLAYSALTAALFAVLLSLDCPAAWLLSPYLIYLFYANSFGYRVWKLNPAIGKSATSE